MKFNKKIVFDVVKKYIDELDPMGLLEMECPPDEYELEIGAILPVAMRTESPEELAKEIQRVFKYYFNEDCVTQKDALSTAEKILHDLQQKKDAE